MICPIKRQLFAGLCCLSLFVACLFIFTDFYIDLNLPALWIYTTQSNLSHDDFQTGNYHLFPELSKPANVSEKNNVFSTESTTEMQSSEKSDIKQTAYADAESSGDWQAVGKDGVLFVYSAHFDDVSSPILRVIAIVKEGYQDYQPVCALFNKLSQDYPQPYRSVNGSMQYVPEPKWGYKYRSAAVICPLKEDDRPSAVTILSPRAEFNASAVPNLLRVTWKSYKTALRYNLTRCVPPLHNHFNGVSELLQMFAFSRKFGTERFIMYVTNTSDAVGRVLELFKGRGLLKVHPWSLPVPEMDIHYFGQLANIQDCIYRNLHVSRYVLTVDVDEQLVPRSGSDLLPVVWRHLQGTRCGILQFTNYFFPKQLPDTDIKFPGRELAEKYRMDMLLKTVRMPTGTSRQKMAIDPTRIEISGIHEAEKYRSGFTYCKAGMSEAFLHHYRNVTDPSEVTFLTKASGLITDTYLHQFSEEIVKSVHDDMKHLGLT